MKILLLLLIEFLRFDVITKSLLALKTNTLGIILKISDLFLIKEKALTSHMTVTGCDWLSKNCSISKDLLDPRKCFQAR